MEWPFPLGCVCKSVFSNVTKHEYELGLWVFTILVKGISLSLSFSISLSHLSVSLLLSLDLVCYEEHLSLKIMGTAASPGLPHWFILGTSAPASFQVSPPSSPMAALRERYLNIDV